MMLRALLLFTSFLGGVWLLAPLQADLGRHVASLRSGAGTQPAYYPGEVIVAFRAADPPDVERAVRAVGGVRARRSAFGPRYLVNLDPAITVPDAMARFATMPDVAYSEPNGTMRAFFTPNDPAFTAQWHMRLIGAERTWDIQKGDRSVVVAVVDTGIAFEDFGVFRKAPDWGDTPFVRGFNVFTRDEHANDDNFHGTHVASTVAEATDNGRGASGLAFNCALMPVKVLDADGLGNFFIVAEGIDHARSFNEAGRRVRVINLSLGGDGDSQAVRESVDAAVAAGIVVVAAAGNDNSRVSFPATLPNVIAVGAVDGRKEKAPYSNFGPEVDVVAPGGDLRRDDDADGFPDGVLQQTFSPTTAERLGRYDDFQYLYVTGTSQATPHVAALAALLVRQGITDPAAVKAVIEQTAEDLGAPGRDDRFGHGLIRPAIALKGLGLNQ